MQQMQFATAKQWQQNGTATLCADVAHATRRVMGEVLTPAELEQERHCLKQYHQQAKQACVAAADQKLIQRMLNRYWNECLTARALYDMLAVYGEAAV